MTSSKDDFRTEMFYAGLETNDPLIADGRLYRFHVLSDQKGSKNGWYFLYPDFPAIGVFGCWKRNLQKKWQPHMACNFTIAALRVLNERKRSIQTRSTQEFHAELDSRREWAGIWENAKPASNRHGYLVSKNVRSHGLRYHQGALLVPVMDPDGNFHGTQRIWPKGDKRFTKGTIITGHYYMIGELRGGTLLICEGYSTGATLHEISGLSVIVTFGSGNLRHVVEVVWAAWPSSKIIICADDDHLVPNNPGLTSATEAAAMVNAELLIPKFPEGRDRHDTDFNDLYRVAGKNAVIDCLKGSGGNHVQNL